MSPHPALTADQFALLQRVIRTVARNNRLNPDDAEDFAQTVHVKLLQRDYDAFDSYEGRCYLSTYLTVVVTRLLLDWRNATQGKWRSSASALRLGPDAVLLERLMNRDGLTREEAIATVASRRPGTAACQVAAIADRLVPRPRRIFVRDVPDDALGRLEFQDPIVAAELRARRRHVRGALRQAYAVLPPEDRRLIALRFGRALTIRAIGDELGTDPKPLYRRLDRALKTLRHRLTALGVEGVGAREAW
jgi:RNA polymerase sigma factor (sigma-70 family)